MTLSELLLIRKLLLQRHLSQDELEEAKYIIDREIKLKQLDPRKD